MAFDAFLKLDGIDGESSDDKHRNEIEVLSYSWGVTQQGTSSAGGGGGAGKASFQDLHFVSRVSKASPKLFLSCATGEHIKEGVITLRKAGGGQQDYLKITLSDILVSAFNDGGTSDAHDHVPLEQISLNYSKIKFDYTPIGAKGSPGQTESASWDLKKNVGN